MLPVQITMRDIELSPALEVQVRKRVEKLSQYYDRINSCRVVIELPQKHKHQGKLFNVRIDVTVPGKELTVTHKKNQDVYIAIRDAFNALERQLEEHSRKRHGRVKTHEEILYGYIKWVNMDEGYGFIEGKDGNEYYFSITNVSHPQFERLLAGDEVEYIPVVQNDGFQAHHITRH